MNSIEKKFKELVIEQIEKHNYAIYQTVGGKSLYIANKEEVAESNSKYNLFQPHPNGIEAVKNEELTRVGSKDYRATFGTSDTFKKKIYQNIYPKLTLNEKNWFIQNIINFNQSMVYEHLFTSLPREDKWLHIANTFNPSTNKPDIYYFLKWFNISKDLEPKNEYEILCFAEFLKSNRGVLTKKEIKENINRYITENLGEEYLNLFPKTLRNIKVNAPNYLFTKTHTVELLKINKSEYYKLIGFEKLKNCTLKKYNETLELITLAFKTDSIKNSLNISAVDLVEFSSTNDTARIFFESNENGFNINLQNIFEVILPAIGKEIENDSSNIIKKIETIINYNVLNQKCGKEDKNSKPKTMKL